MDNTASSAYVWALHEMGLSDFNDERLTQRAVKITATLLQHPHSSIPAGCGNWSDTKATYRFFDNDKVDSQNMLSSHSSETISRCSSLPTVLVAQDTTTMNLTNKQVSGLGRIGMGDLQGFFTHSALAMDTHGIPLGILHQKTYVRKKETQEKGHKEKAKRLPITQKETGKWVEVIDCVKEKLPDRHVVIIGDRESDIFDVFQKARTIGVDVLIRTSQNRLISEVNGQTPEHLFDKAKRGSIITTYTTEMPTTNNTHKTRQAALTIRAAEFLLPIAKNRRREKQSSIPVILLDVLEENPPKDEEVIHWMLTTTLGVKTAEEAIEKVQWYMYRWRIERFHYILKTGAFTVEKLQFETFSRFKKAITMYSIVAWRILFTTYEAREYPNDDASLLFSKEELIALCYKEKKIKQTMTCKEAVKALAKLGGYLARNHDGPPGVKTLWLGFQALQFILYGMLMPKTI